MHLASAMPLNGLQLMQDVGIVTASMDNNLELWRDGQLVQTLPVANTQFSARQICSTDTGLLYFPNDDASVLVYDMHTLQLVTTLRNGHFTRVNVCRTLNDKLYTASSDGKILEWVSNDGVDEPRMTYWLKHDAGDTWSDD